MRGQFIKNGKLANSQDTNFRAVSDDWPVFGLAHDLGTVSGTSPTVVYAVGHVRDPAIQYIVADNARQARNLYFWSEFSSVTDLVCALGAFVRGDGLLRQMAVGLVLE